MIPYESIKGDFLIQRTLCDLSLQDKIDKTNAKLYLLLSQELYEQHLHFLKA